MHFVAASLQHYGGRGCQNGGPAEHALMLRRHLLCLSVTPVTVEKSKNEKVIDLKWIYTKKSENVYKARIVVRGYQQKDMLDDIYSPVAKTQTLKVLLSYCCQNGLLIEQMDVETAFLNGKVKSRVFVKQPEAYKDGTERVCMLNKALYDL